MTASAATLLKDLAHGKAPLICLADGEEAYDADRITAAYETLLPEAERDFNLLVLYGKETSVQEVLSSCRRFPMFAEYQVVILRDAAQLSNLNDLASYLENPSPTTRFYIEHRFKKIDGRGKLTALAKKLDHVVHVHSAKLKEDDVPSWIMTYGHTIGFAIGPEEAYLLTSMLGTDLQKIANEIEKIRINVPEEPALSTALIKKYISAGREYNVFEFPQTFSPKGGQKRYEMLTHFVANPKVAPLVLVLGTFYSHYSRLYNASFVDEGTPEAAKLLGVPPFRVKPLVAESRQIGRQRLEDILLLLADTSAQSVGIGSRERESELLREYCARLELILGL
jgi:DNA polymerase-3 subunit delta